MLPEAEKIFFLCTSRHNLFLHFSPNNFEIRKITFESVEIVRGLSCLPCTFQFGSVHHVCAFVVVVVEYGGSEE